jgi:hypothetical protein
MSTLSLEQLSYDVAYFVLPHYAYNDLDKLVDLSLNWPDAAGPFFYLMACRLREVEPDMETARRFSWHHGELDDAREYFALEYPPPPPVDLCDVPMDQLTNWLGSFVLAPHFSAVIRERMSDAVSYYVLGQAPMGGGTTLRKVEKDGNNYNLGPGPEPELAAFLDQIR